MTTPPNRLRSPSELARPARALVVELLETLKQIEASVEAGNEQIKRNEEHDRKDFPRPYQAPEEDKP